jgi:DNA-binding transcriptional MerR regulator
MSDALTIAALEDRTGVRRSTIHFYLREGLLPAPQKTASSRALYSEEHVRLLRRIAELKASGHPLAKIRTLLDPDLARARDEATDLAGQEWDRVHCAILRVATEEFAANGYDATRVADVIRRVGVTSQVFYRHFPSKLQLLVESFQTFLQWNMAYVEPRLADDPELDLGERILWRLFAHYRADAFASEVLSQLRMERTQSEAERRRLAEQAWEGLIPYVREEFERLLVARAATAGGATPTAASTPAGDGPQTEAATPAIPLDLLANSILGAHFSATSRAAWDENVSRADVLRTHLWLWLAVAAALSGEVDVDGRLARYEPLLRELADREPETPPALEG